MAGLIVSLSCATRAQRIYRVLPAEPDYLVQAPDSTRTPFRDVLEEYTAHGAGWVDLREGMGLRIENACFREGSAGRGLADFLGTEVARYQMHSAGLTEAGPVQLLPQRPAGVRRVDRLTPDAQRERTYHRFFYQVLINPTDTERVAVLLSSDSSAHLDSLTERLLASSEEFCGDDSQECTVFPETSSVAVEMEIFVNGSPRFVLWGSRLSSVAEQGSHPTLFRLYRGQWKRVEFDGSDPLALAVPLLPGDRVKKAGADVR